MVFEDFARRIAELGPLTATLDRRAEPVPGGQSRPAWLSIRTSLPAEWAADGVATWRAIVDGHATEHFDHLNTLLEAIAMAIGDLGRLMAYVSTAYQERDRARAERDSAVTRMRSLLNDGPLRRGRFLVQVSEHDGSAWLQDPVKAERGFGFRYAGLRELWEAWPSLRPVQWGDGRLIVEHVPLFDEASP